MPQSATIHPAETRVRVIRKSVSGDAGFDAGASDVGREYEICHFESGPDNDDPNGRSYYLLDIPDVTTGGDSWAYPEDIEIVRTVEEMAARQAPTREEIAALVGEGAGSAMGDIDVSQVDWSDPDAVEIFGRTADGLEFTAIVKVVSVEQVGP